jgi:hypothetical protein
MENLKGRQSDVSIKNDPLTRLWNATIGQRVKMILSLFYGNRGFFTDLDTAFAAQAFILIHG